MSNDTKRSLRTIIQTLVAIAVILPAVVDAAGIPRTLPWVVVGLAVAGGLAQVMALPGIQALLGWLRTDVDPPNRQES